MSEFTLSPFHELRGGIHWAVAEPARVNVGLVAGSEGALVIDTGSSSDQGKRIRDEAERVARVPVVATVVTHAHFDHAYGLGAFADLPTFGHESVADALAEQAGSAAAYGVRVPADLVGPNRPFSLAATVDLGGRRVEIVHFGRGHTAGDVVVICPDDGIVFAGDLLEESAEPAFGPDSHLKEWPSALDGILGLLAEDSLVVPGHGQPSDRVFAFEQRAAIAGTYGQLEYLIAQGVRLDEAYERGEWPFSEETIRGLLPLAYDQLAREGKVPRTRLPLA